MAGMSKTEPRTETVTLTASDGHQFDAFVADPSEASRAVVIIQELFGVNHHIRSVVEDYAREGFLAIAPALFDRVERGVDMSYDTAGRQRGMELVQKIGTDGPLNDIAASMEYVGEEVGERAVAVVGFCWGGTLAWLAATRRNPAAAVAYYGGNIVQFKDEQPSCPTLLHFGARDAHITPDKVQAIREAHPEVPIHVYDAPHGFSCNDREEYTPEAAREAKAITLKFLNCVLRE